MIAGCGLTHLDLGGGAHVTSVRIADLGGEALAVDATQPLALTLVYDDSFEEAAPHGDVTWTVDDPQIAAIDGNTQVRGRAPGTASLTARYRDQTATATMMVFDLPQALEVQAGDRNCGVGEHLAYGALLRYQHGSTEDVTARATWASDQPAVASVVAGTVTGQAVGDTRVNATYGALTSSADVHVAAAVAIRVDVAPATLQLAIGGTAALRATAVFSDGNTLDATKLVRWQSTLPAAASVGADGTVQALATGRVTITATRDAAVGSAAVTIGTPP